MITSALADMQNIMAERINFMKSTTEHLSFNLPERMAFLNITS